VTLAASGLAEWYQLKQLLEHSLGISMDALHVIIGVILQLAAALLMRRSIADWPPVLAVLAIELANEANDLRTERWPEPAMQYGEGIKDVLLTMFLPVLLLAVARTRPQLLRRSGPTAVEAPPATDHGSDRGAAE
jgi:hypothetical protein